MANTQCTIHGVEMEWHTSKTKFNEDGTAKTYLSHKTADGKLCFGSNNSKSQPSTPVGNYRGEPTFAPMTMTPDADRSHRIERQHSQQMALQYAEILIRNSDLDISRDLIEELTDWFIADLDN